MISLRQCQIDAVNQMKDGCILCGGVGSGKSRTSLAYYFKKQGGDFENNFSMSNPCDLYIITTARKRDTLEWEAELCPFCMSTDPKVSGYTNKVVIDSWNNIKKYTDVKDAFFIFDEQRVVGYGTWTKSFLKIADNNYWVLLSATPGDTWMDYIPVFIANGFYKNKSEFIREHVVYKRFAKFPQVDRYINTGRLIRLRDNLLVDIKMKRDVEIHTDTWHPEYNRIIYKDILKNRWDIYNDKPIENASSLCYTLRRVINSDPTRIDAAINIHDKHEKLIIFYNFDYELELLKEAFSFTEVAQWNGHKHEPIPTGDDWVYLVQYNAGAEGWNCITTNCILFYSQNYSYKMMEQSSGRINRMNSPYLDLYYYHLVSHAGLDLAIQKALSQKKKFNEGIFVRKGAE